MMDLDQTAVCDVHKVSKVGILSFQLSLYPLILPNLPQYITIVSEGQITDFFRTPSFKSRKTHIQKSQNYRKTTYKQWRNARWLGLEQLLRALELWVRATPKGPRALQLAASVHQRQNCIKALFTRSFIVVLSGAKLRR